jgi:hypothetical protein
VDDHTFWIMRAFKINHRSACFLCVAPVKTSVTFLSQKKDPKTL